MSKLQLFMDSATVITPVFGLVPNRPEERRQATPGSRRGRAAPLGAHFVAAGFSRDGQKAPVDRGGFRNPPDGGVGESVRLAGVRPRGVISHGSEPGWNA
jgi:hypothetical protein